MDEGAQASVLQVIGREPSPWAAKLSLYNNSVRTDQKYQVRDDERS